MNQKAMVIEHYNARTQKKAYEAWILKLFTHI